MNAAAHHRQHGGSKINLLITIVILGSMIFVGYKVIPVYFANFQLQDAVQAEARFALANRKSATDVHNDVWRKMQDLGIPATEDAISVQYQGSLVTISVDYSTTFDLVVYQWEKTFHIASDNHSI